MEGFNQTLKIRIEFLGSFNVPLKKSMEKKKKSLNHLH